MERKQGTQRKHSAALFGCRKEQLRPIAMIVLVAMVLTLLPFSALAADEDTQNSTTIKLLDIQSDQVITTPSEIFSELELTIGNSVVDEQGQLELQFNFALDDEVKAAIYNEVTSGSTYGWDEDLFPPIKFSFTLKSDMGIDLQNKMQADVKTSDDEVLGHFTVTPQEGSLLFECELYKSLYDPVRTGISGSGNFGVQFTREDLGSENPVLKWDEKTGEVIIEFPGASKVDLSGTEFTVKKETIGSICGSSHKHLPQETPDLNYTVTLTSAKKEGSEVPQVYLNGMQFKDTIPEGLKVTSVDVEYFYADGSKKSFENIEYILSGQELTKTLPDEEGKDLTKAIFTIRTWLDETEYDKYLGQDKYNKNFTNTAQLIMQDGSDKVLGTDSVTDTITHTFMMKDGEPKGIEGSKFSWKLDISAYFQNSSNVYLIDWIDNPAVHRFNAKTAGLTVMQGSTSHPVTVTELANKGTDYKYESLTLDKLNSLNITEGEAVCYTVQNNGKAEQQVVIIKLPQDWCKGAFSLRYETDIQAEAGSNTTVNNSAKLMWEKVSGPGVNVDSPDWALNIGKTLSGNIPIVQKGSAGYDPHTQHLHWKFDVNHYGNNLKDVTITDTFDANKYQLVESKNHTHGADDNNAHAKDVLLQVGKHPIMVGVHSRVDGSELPAISIPYMEVGSADKDYYNVQKVGDQLKLTVHFANVPEDKMYRVIVHAKVCNKQELISGAKVENTADVSAKVGDTTVKQETEKASEKVFSRVFDKICSRAYHGNSTNDQEIRWRLRINMDNLPLNHIVVTDTLPEGTEFNGFNGAELWMGGALVYKTTTPTDKEIEFTQQGFKVVLDEKRKAENGREQITFKITDLEGKPVETNYEVLVYVRTKYTDDYRNNQFEHNKRITAVNNATLNAIVYDEAFELDAKATTSFTPNLVKKSGTYHPFNKDNPVAYMDWTVRVNEGQVKLGMGEGENYEPAQIIDTLHTSLELDKDSFVISTVVTTDGKVVKDDKVTADFNLEKYLYTQGFAIPIPEKYRNQTLELRFRTYVVNDMQASEMRNRVTLKNPTQKDYDADSSAQGAQNFSLSAMIQASKQPMLTVYKISTQDAAADHKEHVAISGAEFELTAGTVDAEKWTANGTAEVKTTTVGKAAFLRLQKDVVYRLQETIPPKGYELTEDSVQYLVFTENPEKYQNSTVIDKALKVEKELKVYTLQNNNLDSFKTSITVTNTPTAGSIVGHKVDGAGAPVKGALLGLYEAVPTQVEGEPLVENRLQEAESDEHGQFSFAGLDAGTYIIKEVRAPEGYYLSDKIVTVVLTEDNCGPNAAPVTVDRNKQPIKIVDEKIPSAGSVVGKKVDTKEKPLAGAEFTLTCEHGIVHTAVSDADGEFRFDNLQPSTYRLKETKAPEGYELTDKEYTVKLEKENCGVDAVPVEVGIASDGKEENKPEDLTFVNQRAAGFGGIEGKKLAKENSQPLAGAVIGLFAANDEEDNDHSGKPKYTCITDENGVFRFYDLTPGEYHVREITAPEGYKLNETPLFAKLSEQDCRDGVTVTVDHSGYDLVIWNELENPTKPPVTKPEEPVTPPSGGGGGSVVPPEQPEIPTTPPETTEPTEPVEPENPEQPTEPVEPEEPVTPENPTELPDPNVPDSPDEITIREDGIPVTYVKKWDPETEQYIYIPEEEAPIIPAEPAEPEESLGDAPATGDNTPITAMLLLLAASAVGLRVVTRKETE